MSFIISLLVAFAIGFTGHSAPAPEAPAAPATHAVPAQWVCAVDSTTECSDVLTTDAHQTIMDNNVKINPKLADKIALVYLGSSDSNTTPNGPTEFSYPSIDLEGVWHHYAYVAFAQA